MDGKLLIAFVTPGTHPIPSGTGTSVERVVHEATSRLSAHVNVVVFGKHEAAKPVREEVNGICYIRPKPGKRATYLQTVRSWLRELRPDIIQVENRPVYAAALKRALPRARIWLSLHSTTFFSPPALTARRRSVCLRRAERIIANSAFLKRRLHALTKGLTVHTVYPGVDADMFRSRWEADMAERVAEEKRAAGFAGKKLVLFAGRLIPIKGPHHLLRIWPVIARKHPDAVLLLIGGARYGSNAQTPYVRRLRALAARSGAQVRFVPFVPYEQMPTWYRMADIAVVPSGRREAFGLVNVEAMACGVPVIATASGGIKEIVAHGETGLLVPTVNPRGPLLAAIDQALSDQTLCESLGRKAAERARALFNWDRTAQSYLDLYAKYR